MSSTIAITVIIVLFIIAIMWFFKISNKLVTLQEQYKNAFGQIDVQLVRRNDLIPNLVNSVKGYMKHENETLIRVMEARKGSVKALEQFKNNLGNESASQLLANSEAELQSAMHSFNLQVEQYPELKANETMSTLTEQLISTENTISFARQAYNDAVTDYNIYRKLFPNSIVSGISAKHSKDISLLQFENREEIKKAPTVSF